MEKDRFDDYPIDEEKDRYGVSASAFDCTGLIPRALKDEFEEESYGDIFPFLPEEEDETIK